jgi:general stress protein YciG
MAGSNDKQPAQARKRGLPRNLARELEIVRLRESGLTLTEIARRVGVSGSSAARALSRQGRADLLGRRGFAAMPAERRRELASIGGKAAHALGRAHEFTAEEAREAGRKGGRVSRRRKGGA